MQLSSTATAVLCCWAVWTVVCIMAYELYKVKDTFKLTWAKRSTWAWKWAIEDEASTGGGLHNLKFGGIPEPDEGEEDNLYGKLIDLFKRVLQIESLYNSSLIVH